MKPTKIMTLIGWAVSATTAGYLLPKLLVNSGGAIPISPWNIIITLPLIGIVLIVVAIPMFKYRKALISRAKDAAKPRPMPMNPFFAVRLVLLAKAISISGAIFSGWHLGVVWLQLTSPVVPSSTLQNVLGLIGALLMTICAIIVERICRIPDDGTATANLELQVD
ncbi:DUF3180 domain-containing protein [Rhodoluna lacicola]|jgi:hypothetical protein|uniref:DUF3180 domain-containing protein n=1 Tax=Rhodoluna lacicola TaxID=529884 RepID=A0A060JK48_9MICO|nr:DUF3180 domain-containing protein [Rhodoluna lacicola]AIC46993.1 Protein of unknown function (DUF3180) [Rhodoluna lacicola]BDS49898.1 hypothetical protein RKACHI23_01600 [Rhodoluna lacicola]